MAVKTEVGIVKVAWIRDRRIPPGKPAPGRLDCKCGHGPIILFELQPDIICQCGIKYTWEGWIVWRKIQ